MPPIAFASPVGAPTLSPDCRPTPAEVSAYAAIIAAKEGVSPDRADAFLREAELQLWAWRCDMHKRPVRRRRSRAAG